MSAKPIAALEDSKTNRARFGGEIQEALNTTALETRSTFTGSISGSASGRPLNTANK